MRKAHFEIYSHRDIYHALTHETSIIDLLIAMHALAHVKKHNLMFVIYEAKINHLYVQPDRCYTIRHSPSLHQLDTKISNE